MWESENTQKKRWIQLDNRGEKRSSNGIYMLCTEMGGARGGRRSVVAVVDGAGEGQR